MAMYTLYVCLCVRMNLVETHLWQNDDWKDQYVGVVPRATTGNKVSGTFVFALGTCVHSHPYITVRTHYVTMSYT